MTKPTGENEMPPVFYGRRKRDPKPINFPDPVKRPRFFEPSSVAIFVLLVLVCVGMVLLAGLP